jgi:hypothetical protein
MHPVAYSAQYEGEDRNRLTVFFRFFMVLPLMIVGFFYIIGAYVATIIAWFALLFTGNYPQGLYDFNAGVVRYLTRVAGYYNLLTDEYPSFGLDDDPNYPVRTLIGDPLPEYDRLKVLFRIFLLIPVVIINYVMGLITSVIGFISWFMIVFTGGYSDGLYKPLRAASAYTTKAFAYHLLITEEFPPVWMEEEEEAPRFGGQLAAGSDPYAAQVAAPDPSVQQPPPPPPPAARCRAGWNTPRDQANASACWAATAPASPP